MNLLRRLACFLPVGAGISLLPVPVADAREWTQHHPLPQGTDLYDLVAADDFLAALGRQGTVLRTTDGETWSPVETETTANFHAGAWNGETLVAAASGGLFRTTDGVSWMPVFEDSSFVLVDITYADGHWIAAGDELGGSTGGRRAAVLRSQDGSSWEIVESDVQRISTGVFTLPEPGERWPAERSPARSRSTVRP